MTSQFLRSMLLIIRELKNSQFLQKIKYEIVAIATESEPTGIVTAYAFMGV